MKVKRVRRMASRVDWAKNNESRRKIVAEIDDRKIHLDVQVSPLRPSNRKNKKTGKIEESVVGGAYLTFDLMYLKYVKKDGTPKSLPRQATSLFTYTTKMICPSFSLPAGPSPTGTCPASMEGTVRSHSNYRAHLKPGDHTLEDRGIDVDTLGKREKRPWDYVCSVCYAGKGMYSPVMNPGTSFAQAIRLRWCRKLMAHADGHLFFGDRMADAIEKHISAPGVAEVAAAKRINPHYFRIHDSGDLNLGTGLDADDRYLMGWMNVASRFMTPDGPRVLFWCPTRMWVFDWFVQRVNALAMSGVIPPNFVLRPSALYVGMSPPNRETLGPGFSAGSMCQKGHLLDERKAFLPTGVHDCPAYSGATTMHNCEAKNCRVCWENPDIEVNYREH